MAAPTRRPITVPTGATALRPQWAMLPDGIRDLVARRCGATIVDALSQAGGFTPGFASRLLLSDGRRVFVKAADDATRGLFSASYRKEAEVVAMLPATVPVPRVQWTADDDGWFVIAFDDVDGQHPTRPWTAEGLRPLLAVLTDTAQALTPVPDGFAVRTFPDEFGGVLESWPDLGPRTDDLRALAAVALPDCDGDTLVHTDIREDNLLVDATGRIWICDWNWVCAGAAWIDTMCVLLGAYGDGVDVDAVIGSHPVLCAVDRAVVDGFLALLLGYFVRASAEAVPESSPFIRDHQTWYAEVTPDWLWGRRGWTRP